ncbi:MAG TPA: MTH1187 family thiamine-binding protein [Symbiobacteriaceae bacterium]|nr:MTH1187 family thiamine-binding protein [Symbiobacteriaceae bacterium]
MALLEISVVPVGTESPSISSFVQQACQEAKRNGIKFDVTPTSTVMEGDLPALLDVARQMHKAAFQGGVQRVVSNISIDERRDKDLHMRETVEAVTTNV